MRRASGCEWIHIAAADLTKAYHASHSDEHTQVKFTLPRYTARQMTAGVQQPLALLGEGFPLLCGISLSAWMASAATPAGGGLLMLASIPSSAFPFLLGTITSSLLWSWVVCPGQKEGLPDAEETCCACLENPRQTVCCPCGHASLCIGCGRAWAEQCPICRAHVDTLQIIYRV